MKTLIKDKKIKLLKDYFEKTPEVLLAFVFGSYAKGRAMEESDTDIAVYLGENLSEKEKEDLESKIYFEISKIIQREVDLMLFSHPRTPACLTSSIFKTGIPLKVADEKLYWELFLQKSLECEDFLNFLDDFLKIKKLAKSLTPELKERLKIRYDFLKSEIEKIEKIEKISFKEFLENWERRKAAERWVETIINASIDIAKIVLASEEKEAPKTYSDALFYFGFLIGLEEKEAERFSKFAGLRNILAHEYLDILYAKIQTFLKDAPELYKRIMAFLEKYLSKPRTTG